MEKVALGICRVLFLFVVGGIVAPAACFVLEIWSARKLVGRERDGNFSHRLPSGFFCFTWDDIAAVVLALDPA